MTNPEIQIGRESGKRAATAMLAKTSWEGSASYWRATACAETLHAYGYWDGFLTVLVEQRKG
jgi:hypothetical protein